MGQGLEESLGIGQRLKELRKRKGLTLKEVGEYLGYTPTAIHSYETDSRKPSADIIHKLADLYETTSDDIIGISNDQSNFKTILNNNKLHWDGIPLREDELDFIKRFLELRIKDKKETDPSNTKKNTNSNIS